MKLNTNKLILSSAILASVSVSTLSHAIDLNTTGGTPAVIFDDTTSAADDFEWVIRGRDEFFGIYNDINNNYPFFITPSVNSGNSFNINSEGDVNLANGSVFIDRSENRLGVGTTIPENNLHVSGGNANIVMESSFNSKWQFNNGAGGLLVTRLLPTIASGVIVLTNDAQTHSIVANSTGVGMGTLTPESQLEIQDDERIEIRMNNTAAENWRITSRGSGLEYGVVSSFGSEYPTGRKMTLSGNGDLEVTGSYSVNATTLNVPDYVFDKDYKLMPLEKLESFIKSKKHLPNISSAKEINTSGKLDMTQMQLKLLEKIEELTLYTIKQESKIKMLQTENIASKTQLTTKNDQLHAQLNANNVRMASLEKLMNKLALSNQRLSSNVNKVAFNQ